MQDRDVHHLLGRIHHDEGEFPPLFQPIGPLDQGVGPLEQHDATGGAEVFAGQAQAILKAPSPFTQPFRLAGQHQGLEPIAVELTQDRDGGRGNQGIAVAATAAGLGSPPPLVEEPVLQAGGPGGFQGAPKLPGVGVEVGLTAKGGEPIANQGLVLAEQTSGSHRCHRRRFSGAWLGRGCGIER